MFCWKFFTASRPEVVQRVACVLGALMAGACRPEGGDGGGDESDSGTGTTTTTTAGASSSGGPAAEVTWHEHVAPIVAEKCTACHRAGGIGPFALTSFAEAQPFAAAALGAIEAGTMPPFLADETAECAPRHGWVDDPRLTEEELGLVRAWVEQGAPEGDPAKAAPLPTPPERELKDADVNVKISAPVTIEGNQDQFLCFSLDPGFTEDTWIDAFQVNPGNDRVVHHVLVYIDETGESAGKANADGYYPCFGGPGLGQAQLLAAWAPGMTPFETPPNVASRIVKGSRLVLNVHYHPTGQPEVDTATSIDLRTRPTLPEYVSFLALIGNSDGSELLPGPNDDKGKEFRIPAGVADHTEEMLFTLDGIPDLRIFAVGTHMHYVGTDMLVGVQRDSPGAGEPAEECLIQTPRWDFSWQRSYAYDAPLDAVPVVSSGDKVYLRCKYNNSMSNPFVVQALAEQGLDAPHDVYLGEETLDEMCLGVVGIAVALKDVI